MDLTMMTLEELRAVPLITNELALKKFTGFVIVPTGDIHDSGYGCMRFVLTRGNEIIGAVGSFCDVVHLNGIGGYGRCWHSSFESRMVPVIGWSIDLLPASGCVRVFTDHRLDIDLDFIFSSFEVFDGGGDDGN